MKKIYLNQTDYKGEMVILIKFPFNRQLIDHIKTIKNAKWSQSLRAWYLRKETFDLHQMLKLFKGIAYIDYSELKAKHSTLVKEKRIQKTEDSVQVPKKFTEHLRLKRYSKNTIVTYISELKKFQRFYIDTDLESLNEEDVKRYLMFLIQKKKVAVSTQNQAISAIKYYYEKILKKPRLLIAIERPRKVKKLPQIISETDVLNLLKQTNNLKHKAIIALLYSSGLRISEVIELKQKDLNFESLSIHVKQAKGFKDRITILANSTAAVVHMYIKNYNPKNYLFEGQYGGKYSPSSINQFIKRNAKAAGIKQSISAHTLRHSFATHLLNNGTDIRLIKDLLGHNSIKTTQIYTHVSDRDLRMIESPMDTLLRSQNTDLQCFEINKAQLKHKINIGVHTDIQ